MVDDFLRGEPPSKRDDVCAMDHQIFESHQCRPHLFALHEIDLMNAVTVYGTDGLWIVRSERFR